MVLNVFFFTVTKIYAYFNYYHILVCVLNYRMWALLPPLVWTYWHSHKQNPHTLISDGQTVNMVVMKITKDRMQDVKIFYLRKPSIPVARLLISHEASPADMKERKGQR